MSNQLEFQMSKELGKLDSRRTGRAATYAKSVSLFSETLKKKEQINMKADFNNLIAAGGDALTLYGEGMMKPLYDEMANTSALIGGAKTLREKEVLGHRLTQVKKDVAYMESRFAMQFALWSEAAGNNDLKPNQQTALPLQYLEAISANSRFVVDFKTVETRTVPRQRVRKFISLDGVRHYLPDAFKDPAVMEMILNKDSQKKNIRVELTPGTKNLLDAFAGQKVSAVDKLSPIAIIKAIYVDDGKGGEKEIVVNSDNAAKITLRLRGRISLQVKDPTNTDIYSIGGELSFVTGEITPLASKGVKAIVIQASLSGGTNQRTYTVGESREDYDFAVDEQIAAKYTFNPLDMKDKLTLENVDGVMSATAIIYDTAVHAKDYYVFRELFNHYTDVKAANALGALSEYDFLTEHEVSLAPSGSDFKPTDPITWREKMIPEGLTRVAYDFKNKLNSNDGFTTVFWGNPNTTRLVDKYDPVISENVEYAGVVSDASVLVASNQGVTMKIVSTRRVEDSNPDEKDLFAIAQSNSPNEETFTFYQYFTYFDTSGNYRDPDNLPMPTITYFDLFKMDSVHKFVGKMTMTNANSTSTWVK